MNRSAAGYTLDFSTRDEIANSAASEALLSVLAKLHTFEGRSRFTTWVFKFGILQANTEMRKAMWADRDVALNEEIDFETKTDDSPESQAELQDLKNLLQKAFEEVLTPKQRIVARALIIDEVPIDVLAQKLESNRNAVYKTLHDVRKKLRGYLETKNFPIQEFAVTK